ncbi:MAG: sensor histidine kinase [Chloroflexota bacterium]
MKDSSTPNQGAEDIKLLPTNIDFATDVKLDRLNLLWRLTLGLMVPLLLVMFTFATSDYMSLYIWVLAPLTLSLFCVLTGWILKYQRYEAAAITYNLGGIAAVSVAMFEATPIVLQVMPFFYVIVVVLAGLMLRPVQTFLFVGLASLLALGLPTYITGDLSAIGEHQIIAVFLMLLGALLSAQVTGELYQVTEWALLNYQRERNVNNELFESRNALKKSLKRSEVLSEQLQESNVQLEEAHTAAEAAKNFRGQFLANMSHELRTPLNAIIGFSETMLKFPMMYDDATLPEAYRADLNQIHTSGQQLLSLINDILDLARVDAGKLEIHMERVHLRSVIDAVITMANGLIGKKPIELVQDLEDPLPEVWADESRVRQVLLNLYSNAAKFTEEGSITLKVRTTDDGVRLSVIDTGEGIPEEQQQVVFEEFKQASRTGGRDPRAGSGLGLAISRQLLDLMNGRIWLESKVGEGSTFHVLLQPYHHSKVQTMEVTSAPAVQQTGNTDEKAQPSTPVQDNVSGSPIGENGRVASTVETTVEEKPPAAIPVDETTGNTKSEGLIEDAAPAGKGAEK